MKLERELSNERDRLNWLIDEVVIYCNVRNKYHLIGDDSVCFGKSLKEPPPLPKDFRKYVISAIDAEIKKAEKCTP